MLNAPVPGIDRDAALARLMTAHGDGVLRVCYLYLKDFSHAQDATQTAFLKAWEALAHPSAATLRLFGSTAAPASPEYDKEKTRQEKAWMMRIAVNTCKNILKSREFRLYAKATPLDQLPEPGYCPDTPDDTVLQAVLSLPDRYREVIVLHFYQLMPLTDVAAALRLPQATVRTRLHRAKKLLQPQLKGWYFDE